jgi:hypothetical protein
VKTLGLCGLGDGGACCVVTSLGALSWSLGFLSFLSAAVASLMLLLFLLFIFDLLVRGSPHHFVSVWPFGFIYKVGRKPVSRVGQMRSFILDFFIKNCIWSCWGYLNLIMQMETSFGVTCRVNGNFPL